MEPPLTYEETLAGEEEVERVIPSAGWGEHDGERGEGRETNVSSTRLFL